MTASSKDNFDYLAKAIRTLCEIGLSSDKPCMSIHIGRTEPGVFELTISGRQLLMVDTSQEIIDDPDLALPDEFPGRLGAVRCYRVTRQDEDGHVERVRVHASSRRFARLYAGAPDDADVERL